MSENRLLSFAADYRSIILPLLFSQAAMLINIMFLGLENNLGLIYYLGFQMLYFSKPQALFVIFLTGFFSSHFYTADLGFFDFRTSIGGTSPTDFINASFVVMLLYCIKRKYLNFSKTQLTVYLAIFVLYIILDSFIMGLYDTSRQQSLRLVQFFLLYIVTKSFAEHISITFFAKTLIYITIYSVALMPLFTLYGNTESYYGGTNLSMAIPVMISMYKYQRTSGKKILPVILFLLLLGLAFYMLWMVNSRRMFIISIFFIGYFVLRRFNLRSFLIFTLSIGTVAALWFGGQLDFLLPDSLKDRLVVTREALTYYDQHGEFSDYSNEFYSGRDKLQDIAADLMGENWLFGIGYLGTTEYIGEVVGEKIRAHNFFLQMILDNGIMGMLLYIFIFLEVLKLMRNRISASDTKSIEYYFFVGILIYYLSMNIISYFGLHMIFAKNEWMFYGLIAGFSNAYEKMARKEEIARRIEQQQLILNSQDNDK